MKTGLVIGYMNGNLGDDLFFKILFDRYPTVKFYFYPPSVLLDKYKKIYKKNKNVVFYDQEEYYLKVREDITDKNTPIDLFPMICERAKMVDFYINIGGSIFMQNPSWKNDDRFILKKIIGKKPSFILGCNFGPGDEEFYNYYKSWFKKFDDICFRDTKSYNAFKELKNTRKADDIVLINEKKKIPIIRNKKTIGISVIDIDNNKDLKKYSQEYCSFLKRVILYYQKLNYSIRLFSFCEEDGDLKTINKILSDINNKNIKVINYGDDIKRFLKEWKKNYYVISTRFHATILALKYKQNFVPIIYSDKTKNYLLDVDKRIKVYDIKELKKIKIEELLFSIVEKNYTSERQFKKLDEYIGS